MHGQSIVTGIVFSWILTYSLTQPLRTAVEVVRNIYCICTLALGLEKNFNLSQTLFWREKNPHNLFDQTIVQNLINLVLLMTKCFTV